MGTTQATLTALTTVLTLTACQPSHTTTAPPEQAATTAERQLADLPIRVEDTGAHYRRADWGDWTHHGNGCDTREQVLRAQGRNVKHGKACRPLCPADVAPCWTSPYDNTLLRDPAAVQIDHRVPVKEAVRSGARHWTKQQRQRFYNDPANLVAVSAKANTSKGDRDPARWQPSNRDTWCSYATGYIATKHTYRLSVDHAERDALAAMLRTCPLGVDA